MKPVVKVWCLPEITEKELRNLFREIVTALCSIESLGIDNETDLIVLFPKDMMKYGLGTEIVVEMTDFFCHGLNYESVFQNATDSIVALLKNLYPDTHIQCRLWRNVNSYHSETQ